MKNVVDLLENINVHLVVLWVHKVLDMAKMGLIYKINPREPGKETIDSIIYKIKEIAEELGGEFLDYKIEPIAFGLYSVTILVSVDESDEVFPSKFESNISNLGEVSSIENVGMTRL